MKRLLILAMAMMTLASCNWVEDLLRYNPDPKVASVGANVLRRSELERLIPDGITAEDSIRMAQRYIHTWALGCLMEERAGDYLPKEERNVAREVEEFRRNLLGFRYEKLYVESYLDTAVTVEEASAYYEEHRSDYLLPETLVKARVISISKKSPYYDMIRSEYCVTEPEDVRILEDACATSADSYEDFSGRWITLQQLSDYLGITLEACRKDIVARDACETDISGRHYLICITGRVDKGSPAPLEYVYESVSDIIVGRRKQQLLLTLEQELFDEGLEKGTLKIYTNEK